MKLFPISACTLLAVTGCSDGPVEFTTPGRAPPQAGDLVITVDGTPRGFGKAEVGKDGAGKLLISAVTNETATEARINFPAVASTVTCAEMPQAVTLQTSSPLDHANAHYLLMRWLATECSITVSRVSAVDAQGFVKGVEGSFTATLAREKDEIGEGREVQGPKTLKASGTFVVSTL